ncbi:unnamed protein product [Orchesella dallaii]|uniref:Malectin domain-containing protein n=1 Tax=Orchesella dallaii TaxID=48710 RepID=A0ABP1R1U4_9HEXA
MNPPALQLLTIIIVVQNPARSSRWHKNALRTGVWKLPQTSFQTLIGARMRKQIKTPKYVELETASTAALINYATLEKNTIVSTGRITVTPYVTMSIYVDHEFNQCFGRKGKGVTGFNYCGETVIANGIEFQGVSFRNYNCLPRNLVKSNCVGTPEEQRLFENEVYTFPQLDFEYDIPEDADYQIVLYFCDARADLRRMDVSLNDNFVKLIEFKQQQATPPVSKVFISTIDFTVQDGVTSLTIASINVLDAPISNGKIKISLRTKFGPGRATPVLSAAYIMKLT